MKKIFVICLSVLLLTSVSNISAESSNIQNTNPIDELVFDPETQSIQDYLDSAYDGELEDGDTVVTRQAIEEGLRLNEELSKSNARMSGEIWTITSTKTVVPYGTVGTKFVKKISAGQTQAQSSSVSFTISGKIKNFQLAFGTSFSKTQSFSGPSGTEAVGSRFATHRMINSIARGTVTQYTVRITDKYSGNFIRNHTYNALTNYDADLYGNLVSKLADGTIYVRNAVNSNVKGFSNETYYRSLYHNLNQPTYIAW